MIRDGEHHDARYEDGIPRHRPCACRVACGDVAEADDPYGVCKGLRRAPAPPLVRIVLVHRDDAREPEPAAPWNDLEHAYHEHDGRL